ncbi:hypothetical protein AUR04nite_19000 [Glutamicibacter uratoxydans]|uniref:Uncharacterized protein n=1 Tax=Glutamicibacter uratoxydans TaxID=43667 RepID=A0A4Y4DSN7_GLUUR|nr:hypothetical protein [Glutamicibacter uratoxydans]GED06368.1 hypothetical protein AUR04nite_19000 [Glutamicibacter uratoxydans]
MTERRRDSLNARIARGEADPISDAEREIVKRFMDSYHEKHAEQRRRDLAANKSNKRCWYQFWR